MQRACLLRQSDANGPYGARRHSRGALESICPLAIYIGGVTPARVNRPCESSSSRTPCILAIINFLPEETRVSVANSVSVCSSILFSLIATRKLQAISGTVVSGFFGFLAFQSLRHFTLLIANCRRWGIFRLSCYQVLGMLLRVLLFSLLRILLDLDDKVRRIVRILDNQISKGSY